MGCVVAVSRSGNDLWRVHARQLQPHLQAITSWEMGCAFACENEVAVCSIVTACGWLLHGMRDDQTLFWLLDRLCSHLGLDRASVDRRWIEIYELVGRNLLNVGQVRDAVRVLKEVVQIQGQALAEDHPSRLASQHELAGAYRANGQVKDAVNLLEEVVRIQGQTLVEDHPSRLASQHNLAIMLWDLGQHSAGLQMMKHVVEIYKQVLDPGHPSRKTSEGWLKQYENESSLNEEYIE